MISQRTERLLAYLRGMPMLEGYDFSVYEPGLTEAPDGMNRMLCGAQGMSHLCNEICVPFLSAVSKEALKCENKVFLPCPRSRFIFVIPLSAKSCLVCGGVLAANSEKVAREMTLKIERFLAHLMSEEQKLPTVAVQPPIGSYKRRHGQQHIRQCRR
jgi:hypothetical protein